jgi:hypothetical protein
LNIACVEGNKEYWNFIKRSHMSKIPNFVVCSLDLSQSDIFMVQGHIQEKMALIILENSLNFAIDLTKTNAIEDLSMFHYIQSNA